MKYKIVLFFMFPLFQYAAFAEIDPGAYVVGNPDHALYMACLDMIPTSTVPCEIEGRELRCFNTEYSSCSEDPVTKCYSEPVCACKQGFVRESNNPNSMCFPHLLCFKKRCSALSLKVKELECTSTERARCYGYDKICNPIQYLSPEDYPPQGKCLCKPGFVRFGNGSCKLPSLCPYPIV